MQDYTTRTPERQSKNSPGRTSGNGCSAGAVLGNTAQLRLRASADLFRQSCGLKRSKYTKYSFTFQTLT